MRVSSIREFEIRGGSAFRKENEGAEGGIAVARGSLILEREVILKRVGSGRESAKARGERGGRGRRACGNGERQYEDDNETITRLVSTRRKRGFIYV